MSVKRAQAEIDSAEFTEWIAYNAVEHFAGKTDYLLAVICAILANTHRKEGTKAFSPEDFLPQPGGKKRQTGQEMEITLRALLSGNNK